VSPEPAGVLRSRLKALFLPSNTSKGVRQIFGRTVALAAIACAPALGFGGAASSGVHARLVPPKPVPAAIAVRSALAKHRLVGLGELHGWSPQHAFFRSLLRDRRLVAALDDIVIEFGNSRYQELADRYFLELEAIPVSELSKIWLDTTQRELGPWQDPIYAQFLDAVRRLNEQLPARDRLRVVLGDPPIDWSSITTTECVQPEPTCLEYWLSRRDRWFAEVVEKEVLMRGRKALMIAGVFHFIRPATGVTTESVTGYLERGGRRVYVVVPQTPFALLSKARKRELAKWPTRSISSVRGTWLGRLNVRLVFPRAFVGARPGPRVNLDRVADAYLHL
jgi:hypothetical protein